MHSAIKKRPATLLLAGLLALCACSGSDGATGATGPQGPEGPAGPAGPGGGAAANQAGAGLQIAFQSVTFAADGTPVATVKFTDGAGKPVDFLAELAAGTFGARGPRYTIARLEADGTYKSLYESASTHAASSYPASVSGESAAQTAARVAAMYTKVADGVYTFKWPSAPAAAPVTTATHTVGTWASRVYGGVTYPDSATLDFVPGGGTPTNREVVSDTACNACHKNLQAHGSRRDVKLCATCHYPGWKDAATGAVIDWRVMVHQIHGSDAPAGSSGMRGQGGTYPGFEHVVFAPRDNEVAKCASCHQGATADSWKNPVAAACYSCHQNPASFSPSHAGFGDAACVLCHGPTTELAVEKVHSLTWDEATNTVAFTPMNIDVAIKSVDATNAAAVKATFTIEVDGAPYDLKNNPPAPALNRIASLRLVAGGPVGPDSDFGGAGAPNVAGGNRLASGYGYVQSPALTTPANLTEVAVGEYTVTFPALDAAAVGTTIAIGAEGYAGEEDVVEWAINRPEIFYAKVGGGEPTPRRAIADDAKCNACHLNLGFHGGNGRKGVVYCSVCHNSSNVNDERVSRFEVDPANTAQRWKVQPQSVWLPVMVHRLHRGGDLANRYTLGGNPGPSAANPAGSQHDFSGAFPQPGAMLNCLSCHQPGTFGLPGPAVQPMVVATYECFEDPTVDVDNLCNGTTGVAPNVLQNWRATTKLVPPQQAICTSCHDDDGTAAHVELNTTAGGLEACSVCHGDGSVWDAATVHVAPQ